MTMVLEAILVHTSILAQIIYIDNSGRGQQKEAQDNFAVKCYVLQV